MPTWKDYERFLRHDDWTFLEGQSGRDRHYQKVLDDGSILRTRVSKSSSEIGSGLFSALLKQQVQASKPYFNRVLANKKHSSNTAAERW